MLEMPSAAVLGRGVPPRRVRWLPARSAGCSGAGAVETKDIAIAIASAAESGRCSLQCAARGEYSAVSQHVQLALLLLQKSGREKTRTETELSSAWLFCTFSTCSWHALDTYARVI